MDERDDRVPVLLGEAGEVRPGDLVLPMPPPAGHVASCRCCGGRDPLASALSGAFVARARGQGPWFDRVLLLDRPDATRRLAAVLTGDPVAQARFRAVDR